MAQSSAYMKTVLDVQSNNSQISVDAQQMTDAFRHPGGTERSAIAYSNEQEILTMATITAPELPEDEVIQ